MDPFAQVRDPQLPPLVVAELSGNHGGDLEKALELVDRAAESGADAIKLQTYKPETITVEGRDDRFLLKDGLWKGKYLSELYALAMTPWEWHLPLAERAARHGLSLFSSPFDESAVDFLEEALSPSIYKVASFELNHFPMLRRIGSTGKPVLASVGVSGDEEIEKALAELRASGCPEIVLLHCVSEYPARPEDFRLKDMPLLGERHGTLYGLSDHSPGHAVAVASAALGARVIEKHFTLDREEDSIDGAFSMLPLEFGEMAEAVRVAHSSVTPPDGSTGPRVEVKPGFFKRSILVSTPIAKGEVLSVSNLRVARPGDGLCPSRWEEILGKRAAHDLEVGHPLAEGDLEG